MSQSLPQEPVLVEPVVNNEKLRELLALQTEYSTLDFKDSCDLSEKRDQVELAKDVGAMSVLGGFLVIGVDGQGGPTGGLTAEQARLFDEARLRPKLLKWLPDSLEICSQVHEVDGHLVALVHVAPNPAGCAYFRDDGQYDQPPKIVFRRGDAYFRDGTQSKRLDQQGHERVIAQRVARERARWEAEQATAYQRLADQLRAGFAGRQVAQGPAAEFSLTLEPSVLTEAAVELLRADDDIPLRRLLREAVPQARELFGAGDQDGLDRILDRLACLAATFLDLDRRQWFSRVVDAMVAIYGLGFEGNLPITNQPPRASAALWVAIIERVMALGSLAVRRQDWEAVRDIASRRHPDMHSMYTNWVKHTMTMAARAGLLTQRSGADAPDVSLLALARDTTRRLACLRPDLEAGDEQILTSVAQFDFLTCLAAVSGRGNEVFGGVFYPSFAWVRSARTQPIAERLLREPALRTMIYSGDDASLAAALRNIDQVAQREGFRFDGWEGYTEPVRRFIDEHYVPAGGG
jgi:hypothetical protein